MRGPPRNQSQRPPSPVRIDRRVREKTKQAEKVRSESLAGGLLGSGAALGKSTLPGVTHLRTGRMAGPC